MRCVCVSSQILTHTHTHTQIQVGMGKVQNGVRQHITHGQLVMFLQKSHRSPANQPYVLHKRRKRVIHTSPAKSLTKEPHKRAHTKGQQKRARKGQQKRAFLLLLFQKSSFLLPFCYNKRKARTSRTSHKREVERCIFCTRALHSNFANVYVHEYCINL